MSIDYFRLESDGCLVIRDAIDVSIYSEFETEIDDFARLLLRRQNICDSNRESMAALLASNGELRKVLFPQLRNLRVLHKLEQQIIKFFDDSGFFDWANMGAPSIHRIFKADVPGEDKYLLPMHQDYNTPVHVGWRAWIPLRHATPANGTIKFARGSHATGFISHDVSNPELPQVVSSDVSDEDCEVLDLAPGGVFLFHPLLVHASVPATAEQMKYALILNLWDLATMVDPEDQDDPINARMAMGKMRDIVRGDRDPIRRAKPA
ncbi:MAG: phytanoyl-CoA dioxygenase family protein [Boseongicola sp.]